MKVVNLTDFPLNKHHLSLLSRGLSFSPKSGMNEFEVYKDISLYLRKVIFRYWHSTRHTEINPSTQNKEEREALDALVSLLQENADSDSDIETPPELSVLTRSANLSIRSVKMPPLSKHKSIEFFLAQVKRDLSKVDWKYRGIDNLTREERKALKELEETPGIVIKGSDKGGNLVLLTEDQYENEVLRLLGDKSTYRKFDSNTFPDIVNELNYLLSLALEEKLITRREFNFLRVSKFNTPTFYIIPKLHKSLHNPPGRPIVSAVNGPLEKTGKSIDALIKELVHDLPSYVQDTRDVLLQLDAMVLPEGSLMVGIDVESLYTSIPHV